MLEPRQIDEWFEIVREAYLPCNARTPSCFRKEIAKKQPILRELMDLTYGSLRQTALLLVCTMPDREES